MQRARLPIMSGALPVAGVLLAFPSGLSLRCQEVDPSDRMHDGFFFAARAGVSSFFGHEEATPPIAPFRTALRGVGQSAEIAVGGTPWPGLVLGGSLWTARIDPSFVEGGRTVTPDDDSVKITVARIGPFLDWYPWPRRGFHTAVAAGLGFQAESDVKGNPIRPPWLGAGVSVGSGYEWFVSSQSSLGFFARVTLFDLFRRTLGAEDSILSIAPEVAVSFAYH